MLPSSHGIERKEKNKYSLHWSIKAQLLRWVIVEGKLGEKVHDLRSNSTNDEVPRLIPLMRKRYRIIYRALGSFCFARHVWQLKEQQHHHHHKQHLVAELFDRCRGCCTQQVACHCHQPKWNKLNWKTANSAKRHAKEKCISLSSNLLKEHVLYATKVHFLKTLQWNEQGPACLIIAPDPSSEWLLSMDFNQFLFCLWRVFLHLLESCWSSDEKKQ